MAIVFLDGRISTFLINGSGDTLVSTTPILIGDIGLQVTGALSDPEKHLERARSS
ncbi:hypothetical protein [Paenibacillus herberti]|uniref:hypothetical protein n=1 Tax=Paenibacillus herberti TaxID=1619309 RepID=UPI0015961D7D|nr:hypothetical protein [Paenibacillus herberti]